MSKIDKFEYVTNVRESLCAGQVIVESLDEVLLHVKGKMKREDMDLEVIPAMTSGSLIPAGYRPVPDQECDGRPVYERIRKYDS